MTKRARRKAPLETRVTQLEENLFILSQAMTELSVIVQGLVVIAKKAQEEKPKSNLVVP